MIIYEHQFWIFHSSLCLMIYLNLGVLGQCSWLDGLCFSGRPTLNRGSTPCGKQQLILLTVRPAYRGKSSFSSALGSKLFGSTSLLLIILVDDNWVCRFRIYCISPVDHGIFSPLLLCYGYVQFILEDCCSNCWIMSCILFNSTIFFVRLESCLIMFLRLSLHGLF